VRSLLNLKVDELERRSGLFQHAPAAQPIVGPLHLVVRDRRGVADDDSAFANVRRLQLADPWVTRFVIVDEIVEIGLFVGVDALDGFAYGLIERTVSLGVDSVRGDFGPVIEAAANQPA
jgi:hypothetical protein